VLIGQFTTDGIFHYELNLQIGGPGGIVQQFVASNPTGTEITLTSLSGTLGAPNTPPTVSVTSPSNGATFLVGASVPFNATAADADGTVDSVQFYVDGIKVGSDLSSPYTFSWTATVGAHALTAKATDNGGTTVTSSPVNITVGNIIPPAVSISSPANGATFFSGAVIAINANAADADGTVDSVEFYVDGSKVGSDLSSPYSFNWTSTIGTHALTAKATDNNGATTTSAPVTIQVFSSSTSYALISSSNKCDGSVFCLPLNAIAPVANVIGYDIVLNYNKNKVTPTGVVTVANALINPNYTSTANSINSTTGTMLISVFFNASAPPSAAFTGTGQLLCVEFAKTASFGAVDTAAFSISSIQESYFNGVQPKLASNGEFRTYQDTIFQSSLKFWFDNSPIKYNAAVPADYLVTNIYGSNGSCTSLSATSVRPNLAGNFSYNVNNGVAINIQKDIPGTTDVQPVINGFDAFLTRRVLVNDPTFVPSIYQAIAMDVNTDGVISAGDLSQINQRTVLLIPEFKQAWNYNSSGVSNGQLSKDWLFIDGTRLNSDPAYLISATYPANDGIGYSKSRVPVVPFCLTVPSFTSNICQTLGSETYQGVLLGDVNGNYATYNTGPNSYRMSDRNQVVFDLTQATVAGGYAEVPVMIYADGSVNALDFSMKFNESKLTFLSVNGQPSNMESLVNYNSEDKTLRFTSYSLQGLNAGQTLATVRFAINGDQLTEADFSSLSGLLNGEMANARLKTSNFENAVSVYPNPATNLLNVEVTEDATIQLLDAQGRSVVVLNHKGADLKGNNQHPTYRQRYLPAEGLQ
jgi:chitodextrinase